MRRPALHFLARCSLVAGSLVAPNLAHADAPGPSAPPIQVIAVRSDDAEDQADALTAALRNRVRALRGYSLGDGDYALEVLTLGLKCGESPDEACQVKIGNQIHADRFVWGTVKRSKSTRQVTAELHLWTRGRTSTKTEFTFSDNLTAPGDDGLRRLVDDALSVLLERKAPASTAPAARPAARTAAATSSTAVAPSPGDASEESAPAADTAPSSSTSNLHSTLGWTGVGVGAALIGAGIFSALKVNSIENDEKVERYRQGFRPDIDSCKQAEAGVSSRVPNAASPEEMQDFCSSAGTFQALQFVFFGLGAISAGAGIYLLASDGNATTSRSKTHFAVAPPVGRSPARFEFTLQF
ncbi:MAG: hypothetical protein ABW133_02540 [Polyangiaceae bacterium]